MLDTRTTAQLARVMDALRGGRNCVREDRELAETMERLHPGAAQALLRCGKWAVSSAAAAVSEGMTGVILGGLGFPAGAPPHAAAMENAGTTAGTCRTRFLYAGCDKASAGLRGCSIPPGDPAAAAAVPVTDPAAVLKAAEEAGFGPGRLQVQLGTAAAYLSGEEARETVAAWAQALPHGSEVALLVPLRGYLGLAELTDFVPYHEAGDPAAWLRAAGLEEVHPVADVRTWGQPGWGRPGRREHVIPAGAGTRVAAAAGTKV